MTGTPKRQESEVHGLDRPDEVAVLKREVGPVVGGEDRLAFDTLYARTVVNAGPDEVAAEKITATITRTGMRPTPRRADGDGDRALDLSLGSEACSVGRSYLRATTYRRLPGRRPQPRFGTFAAASTSAAFCRGRWLRGLVLTYLIVATLVGPRLCPCSTACWGTPPGSASRTSPAADPRSCPCHAAVPRPVPSTPASSAELHPDAGGRDESPPAPAPAPYQCKCAKSDAAVVRGVWRSGATFDGPLAGPAVITPTARFASRAGPTASHVGPAGNRPFYSTDDLLYGFHFLRC